MKGKNLPPGGGFPNHEMGLYNAMDTHVPIFGISIKHQYCNNNAPLYITKARRVDNNHGISREGSEERRVETRSKSDCCGSRELNRREARRRPRKAKQGPSGPKSRNPKIEKLVTSILKKY